MYNTYIRKVAVAIVCKEVIEAWIKVKITIN